MRVFLVLSVVALCVAAVFVAAEERALQPANATPTSNAAQIAELKAQVQALKAPRKYYNVRQNDVAPGGAKKTSGQFAKKPAAPAISPWSAQIMAAKRGDAAALAAGPTGPFLKGENSYPGSNTVGPAGWCGSLVNGWVVMGKCGYNTICYAGSLRPHGGRTYSCSTNTGSYTGPADKNPDPPANLPTLAPPAPPKPVYVDRCQNRCYGNQCCKSTGPGASDYYQCMNC